MSESLLHQKKLFRTRPPREILPGDTKIDTRPLASGTYLLKMIKLLLEEASEAKMRRNVFVQ